MARLVRDPVITEGAHRLEGMPQLQGNALERYRACVNDRIKAFSSNEEIILAIWEEKKITSSHKLSYDAESILQIQVFSSNKRIIHDIMEEKKITYSHKLSYDAESMLWLLFWWAIQIQPKDGNKQDRIPGYLWNTLTARDDCRHTFLRDFPYTCHPTYRPLEVLLKSLFRQLSGYQEYLALLPEEHDDTRMKDEYLHEAFQRILLEFIVQNKQEEFMREQISPTRRPKEGGGMAQSIRTPGKA